MKEEGQRSSCGSCGERSVACQFHPPSLFPSFPPSLQATVQTLLDKLADEGSISRKEMGKAKIYVAPPPPSIPPPWHEKPPRWTHV